MPGRQFTQSNSNYRYGFNGKENDNKDGVVQYDYGFRIYDPRLVRFKSVDPLIKDYPYYTPYQFAGNSPIELIDIDGGEGGKVIIDGINTIVDGIKNFFSFKSEREEIQQGVDNVTEGVAKQTIGPWDWRYFNSENPGLDFELRRIDGQIQSTTGTVQISSGIQGISQKVETVVKIPLILKNTSKPAIKKLASEATSKVKATASPQATKSAIPSARPNTFIRTESLSGNKAARGVGEKLKIINETGTLPPIEVAKINDKLYIINGHHRVEAAKMTNTKLEYKVLTKEQLQAYKYKDQSEVIQAAAEASTQKIKLDKKIIQKAAAGN